MRAKTWHRVRAKIVVCGRAQSRLPSLTWVVEHPGRLRTPCSFYQPPITLSLLISPFEIVERSFGARHAIIRVLDDLQSCCHFI
jgi:hypothetical protein